MWRIVQPRRTLSTDASSKKTRILIALVVVVAALGILAGVIVYHNHQSSHALKAYRNGYNIGENVIFMEIPYQFPENEPDRTDCSSSASFWDDLSYDRQQWINGCAAGIQSWDR
jgi:hypothetical protein